jgi:hypothetical protein
LEQLVVVTHPHPVVLEARPVVGIETPDDSVALGYYHEGNVLARGVVATQAVDAIHGLLRDPVSVALAATEDEDGSEPWRASVPRPPSELSGDYEEERPRMALLPIGNAVRGARYRNHPDVASDVREMLLNLLAGRGQDAVSKAIDDLLGSL